MLKIVTMEWLVATNVIFYRYVGRKISKSDYIKFEVFSQILSSSVSERAFVLFQWYGYLKKAFKTFIFYKKTKF